MSSAAGDVNVGICSAVNVALTVLSTLSIRTHSQKMACPWLLVSVVQLIQQKIQRREWAMSSTKAVKPSLRTGHSACLC